MNFNGNAAEITPARIETAFKNRNIYELEKIFTFTFLQDDAGLNSGFSAASLPNYDDTRWNQISDSNLADFAKAYVEMRQTCVGMDEIGVWEQSVLVLDKFIRLFTYNDGHWLTSLLKKMCRFSFNLYYKINDETERTMKSSKMAESLQRVVKIQISDRTPLPDSKRIGIYYIVNLLLHLSIQMGSIGSVMGLVVNIRKTGPPLSKYPMVDQIGFRYWLGRYYMLKHEVKMAQEEFTEALRCCSYLKYNNRNNGINNIGGGGDLERFKKNIVISKNNKKRILEYLVCCNLILGRMMIPQELLREFGGDGRVKLFLDLSNSYKLGNLQQFQRILAENSRYFRKRDMYMILYERTENGICRNAIRRLYRLKQQIRPQNNVLLYQELAGLFSVMNGGDQGQDAMDEEDIECVLANLIEQGYIKGHLQPGQKAVVLSRTNAFPPIYRI